MNPNEKRCCNSITGPHKNSVNAYSECTCTASVPPLPSGCLSSHPSISMTALTSFPPLHRELICRNVPAALCDHLVNTPIILSASASPYHPVVEMTPEGLTVQFTLNGWQLSRQHPCASLFLLTFIFPCQERDAAGARPAVHPARLPWCLLSSSLLVLWGEMLPLVYATLSVAPTHTFSPPLHILIKQIIPPLLPLLFSSPPHAS